MITEAQGPAPKIYWKSLFWKIDRQYLINRQCPGCVIISPIVAPTVIKFVGPTKLNSLIIASQINCFWPFFVLDLRVWIESKFIAIKVVVVIWWWFYCLLRYTSWSLNLRCCYPQYLVEFHIVGVGFSSLFVVDAQWYDILFVRSDCCRSVTVLLINF